MPSSSAQTQPSSEVIKVTSDGKVETICNFKPEIPINPDDAFFPMLPDGRGVFYSWEDCKWWGLKCNYVEVEYLFANACHMQWFINNDYGLKKREAP